MEITKDEFLNIIERMAQNGTAPEYGCSYFGIGYEDAYNRIKNKYLIDQFNRGMSSEKFVVGPYGSGKTHFIRQLMEIAQDLNCITCEVALNKDIDFTKTIIIYSEIVRALKVPGLRGTGIRHFLYKSIDMIKKNTKKDIPDDIVINEWINHISEVDFELDSYGKVLKKALTAIFVGNNELLDATCRWLEGDFENSILARELGVAKVEKSSSNRIAKRAILSLFQFIKYCGYRGTVLCFDEAEQGFSVDRKKTNKILSMLMSWIEAITNLRNGSVLIVYALTPDIIDKMKNYAALQQRIINQYKGFFDGNTLAPLIDLQNSSLNDILLIGNRLLELFYRVFNKDIKISYEDAKLEIKRIAKSVAENNVTSSNRRDMVKATCTYLIELLNIANNEVAATSHDDLIDEREV